MERDLLTTRDVAKILGVGTTSIKRWADSGLLRCVKTPGGHRRFPRESVEVFQASGRGEIEFAVGNSLSRTERWMTRLRDGVSTNDAVKMLHHERDDLGTWHEVADSMATVLEEIGRAWARGDLSVIQEHILSERIQRALARVVESQPLLNHAPTCMLMAAETEDHTLGLSLVELCLREAGWNTTWAGRMTPIHIACEFILGQDVQMVAVSASEFMRDSYALADQAERLARACQQRSIPLLLGGKGLWPENPAYGHRITTFAQLHQFLQSRATE